MEPLLGKCGCLNPMAKDNISRAINLMLAHKTREIGNVRGNTLFEESVRQARINQIMNDIKYLGKLRIEILDTSDCK